MTDYSKIKPGDKGTTDFYNKKGDSVIVVSIRKDPFTGSGWRIDLKHLACSKCKRGGFEIGGIDAPWFKPTRKKKRHKTS